MQDCYYPGYCSSAERAKNCIDEGTGASEFLQQQGA